MLRVPPRPVGRDPKSLVFHSRVILPRIRRSGKQGKANHAEGEEEQEGEEDRRRLINSDQLTLRSEEDWCCRRPPGAQQSAAVRSPLPLEATIHVQAKNTDVTLRSTLLPWHLIPRRYGCVSNHKVYDFLGSPPTTESNSSNKCEIMVYLSG